MAYNVVQNDDYNKNATAVTGRFHYTSNQQRFQSYGIATDSVTTETRFPARLENEQFMRQNPSGL
jgi:hypothetical protein